MQSPPCVRLTFNRLPSWKRNTPAPATLGKKSSFGPEQVLDGSGVAALALILRKVNGPSVPFPAIFSSLVIVLGICRLTTLAAPVPENTIDRKSTRLNSSHLA